MEAPLYLGTDTDRSTLVKESAEVRIHCAGGVKVGI